MNENKVAFIICANDEIELRECEYYIRRLTIPEFYEVELLVVWDAVSMTNGYQEAMHSLDVKYKIYLHQDVFIINRDFISDMLKLFVNNPQVGMFGCVGATRITGGCIAGSKLGYWKVVSQLDSSGYRML